MGVHVLPVAQGFAFISGELNKLKAREADTIAGILVGGGPRPSARVNGVQESDDCGKAFRVAWVGSNPLT